MQFVTQTKTADPSLSLKQLARAVEEKFDIVVHPRSITRQWQRPKKHCKQGFDRPGLCWRPSHHCLRGLARSVSGWCRGKPIRARSSAVAGPWNVGMGKSLGAPLGTRSARDPQTPQTARTSNRDELDGNIRTRRVQIRDPLRNLNFRKRNPQRFRQGLRKRQWAVFAIVLSEGIYVPRFVGHSEKSLRHSNDPLGSGAAEADSFRQFLPEYLRPCASLRIARCALRVLV
jgi:hypothetical protein